MKKKTLLCLLALIFGMITHPCIAAEDDQRPTEHFCPITMERMTDPVVAADGHSYERDAILQHCNIRGWISPITRQPLENMDLFPNQALKAMIQDWKPGRHYQPSPLENRSTSDIAQRIKDEFTKRAALFNAARGHDIVAFLGNTGAGKSTLVNLLANKELRVSNAGRDYVLVDPKDNTAMVIGTGGSSETLYPQYIDVGNLRLFDLPGFNDTDGSERNLVNAAFVRQVVLDASSVRIVFVVGEDQFTADRSASVRQMFSAMRRLFVTNDPNENVVDGGAFVVTKVTCDDQAGDMVKFLLEKTNSTDKEELNTQLQSWAGQGKFCQVPHPLLAGWRRGDKTNFSETHRNIIALIQDIRPLKISGLNVSVLYPPETVIHLEKVFYAHMEDVLKRHLNKPALPFNADVRQEHELAFTKIQEILSTLKERNNDDFWPFFQGRVIDDKAIDLLKDFCLIPYGKALQRFMDDHQGSLRRHVESLDGEEKRAWNLVEKMFYDHMDEELREIFTEPVLLSDIESKIGQMIHQGFWPTFGHQSVSDEVMTFWKGKNNVVYNSALVRFQEHSQQRVDRYVEVLKEKIERRIKELEEITHDKAEEAVQTVLRRVQAAEVGLAFDFSFHREIYDHVCDAQHIAALTQDAREQDIVRRACALFMSHYAHRQIDQLVDARLALIEQRLRALEPPSSLQATAPAAESGFDVVPLPILSGIIIPEIARGYEKIYRRFLNGKLIYTDPKSKAKIELPISDLANPLEGTFDLSRCGDTGRFLSISTGYRKGKKAENSDKAEIWFAPRFLIKKQLTYSASHFQRIMDKWDRKAAPVGIFWTWGEWDDLADYFYSTSESLDDLGRHDLYEKCKKSSMTWGYLYAQSRTTAGVERMFYKDSYSRLGPRALALSNYIFELSAPESVRHDAVA